jgi:GcrA cell cycle regulator
MAHDVTEAVIARVRELWHQTNPVLSTKEISRLTGRSKNSVVGIAHRNDFAKRPSPIITGGGDAVAIKDAKPKPPALTLPDGSEPPVMMPLARKTRLVFEPKKQRLVKAAPVLVDAKPVPKRECCWPIGEPGKPNFRFCDTLTANRTYCDEHASLAYVKVREREPVHA